MRASSIINSFVLDGHRGKIIFVGNKRHNQIYLTNLLFKICVAVIFNSFQKYTKNPCLYYNS